MDETRTPQTPSSYVPPVVDESQDWDIGPVDIVLGILTFPLLMWVLQYAVSGSEKLIATRRSRLRIYLVLLALEAVIITGITLWILR